MDTFNQAYEKPRVCRQFYLYDYTDLKAVEEHCADMARKGWRLTSIRNSLTFEECVPCVLRYSVEVLPAAAVSGNEINDECRTYIDLCAEAGWTFVSNHGDIFVFVTSDPDIPPVVTDSREKIQAIRRGGRRNWLLAWALLVLNTANAGLLMTNALMSRETRPVYFDIMMPLVILLFALDAVCLTVLITQLITHLRWYKRANAALEAGEPIPFCGQEALKRRNVINWMVVGLSLAMVLGYGIWDLCRGQNVGMIVFVSVMIILAVTLLIALAVNRRDWSGKRIAVVSILLGLLIAALAVGLVILLIWAFDFA